MKIILVNPWITDFAAYNFWIRPLGLYRLAEWLYERGARPVLLDALTGAPAPGKFRRQTIPLPDGLAIDGLDRSFARYGICPEEFLDRLEALLPADGVLITSAMSYWYPGVFQTIELIRKAAPAIPIGLGGIYATLWPRHAARFSGADRIFVGDIDSNGAELAGWLGLPDRPVRQQQRWYALGLHDGARFSGIRTATGCPFRCSYCASLLVSGPFRERDPHEIMEEITALYGMGVRSFCFYDDALLVNFDSRLGPVLERVIDSGIRASFHTPNGLHARLLTSRAARLMARAGFETVRLSLETVDITRQLATGGKVSCQEVEQAVAYLLEAGMRPESIGVYLLAGLPGQELSEVEEGISFVKSLGVRPYIAEYSPIPRTIEWQRLEEMGLVSERMDPLLTNNTIFYWHILGIERGSFSRLKEMARA